MSVSPIDSLTCIQFHIILFQSVNGHFSLKLIQAESISCADMTVNLPIHSPTHTHIISTVKIFQYGLCLTPHWWLSVL